MKIKSIDPISWKCPKCKKNHFQDTIHTATATYFPPIFKNGVNMNPDRNIVCFERHCANCGHSFAISGNEYDGWTVGVINKPK